MAVITGAFTGDEVAGAVTRFEDFQAGSMRKEYGPASGKLLDDGTGRLAAHQSGLWARDLVTEAIFTSPTGRDWNYGFVIRSPESNRLEIITVAGNNQWVHHTRDVGDDEYTEVENGRLSPNLRSQNHLLLMALDDWGILFVNGEMVSRLDLRHNLDYGSVAAVGGFYGARTGDLDYENFNVWTP